MRIVRSLGALAALGLAMGVPSASAADADVSPIRTFGAGQLNFPHGIAINGSGDVYVADTDNERIDEFSATGAFIRTFGTFGGGAGQLGAPDGVAVDSSNNVYLADVSNNRIDEFSADGVFIEAYGWGVADGASQLEICTTASTCQSGLAGAGAGQFSNPVGIAINSSGDAYVIDGANHRMEEFSAARAFIGTIGTGQLGSVPDGVAVDSSGDVYVTDATSDGHSIEEFSAGGVFIRTIGGAIGASGTELGGVGDIAIDSSGDVYVTNAAGNQDPIDEFSATGTFIRTIGPALQSISDNEVFGIAVDSSGDVYVADDNTNQIDEYGSSAAPGTLAQGPPTSATVADNAGYSDQLTITNASGTVSYTENTSADSSDVVVNSSGAITAATTLAQGTYTVGGTDSDTAGDSGTWSFTLTVPLAVDSITFQQQSPTGGSLQGVPAHGTYDGNIVQVQATISNISDTPQSADVNFTDSGQDLVPASGAPVGQGSLQDVTVPANKTLTVSMDWDTSGQAWTSTGVPASQHTIEVDLSGANESQSTRLIFVNPRPVILVHGWNSDYTTWASQTPLLGQPVAGYLGGFGWIHEANPDWHAYAVGDGQAIGVMHTAPFGHSNTIAQNAAVLAQYTAGVRRQTGAWHVDIVAHSMGGLISRQYINSDMPADPPDGRPVVTHLVMLGTPNQGSVCADYMIAADLAAQVTVGTTPPPSIATWQLTPESMQEFNATVTQTKGVQFSILAGDVSVTTCGAPEDGDLIVPVTSALWNGLPFEHRRIVGGLLHFKMTSSYSVFSTWVVPLLTVGSAPASADLRRSMSRAGTEPARAATKAKPKPERKAKVRCAQTSSTAGTIADGGVSTVAHGTKVFPMRVGAAQRMTVTVFSGGPVVVRVLNGPGKVVDSSSAASGQSGPVFESWTIDHPASGAWKLSITDSAGSSQVAYFVTQTKPAVALSAHLSESASGQVLLTAQPIRSGRPVANARLTGFLISAAGRRLRVRLTAEPRHPGLYRLTRAIRLAASTAAGGIDAALIATGPGFSVSTMESDDVSCHAVAKR